MGIEQNKQSDFGGAVRLIAASITVAAGFLLCATGAEAQSIVSHTPIDLSGDSVTFPESGDQFGSLAATYNGIATSDIRVDAAAPHYGTDFNGVGTPSSGDAVQYFLDGDYTPTSMRLWNDANYSGGQRDGIADFVIRFFDASGSLLGQEAFTAAETDVLQTFNFTGSYDNVRSFYLIVNSSYTRRPVQWREIEMVGTLTPAAPEIDVNSSEGGAVADGGTDTQSAITAGTPRTVTYTITNNGTATLTLGGTPTVSGATNLTGPLTVSAPGSLSLAPGASTTFNVTYTPASGGAFGFDIDISSDDADEGTYDIAVAGTASSAPEIEVSSSEGGAVADGGTDAHSAPIVGTPRTVTYTVTNSGTETLNLGGTPTVSGATNISGSVTVTAPGTLTVPAGGSTTFDVTYTVAAVGAFGFDLDIASDDADESTYDIAVSGTIGGGPEIDVSSSEGGPVADGGTDTQGTPIVGTPRTVTYTIDNTGTGPLTLTGTPTTSGATNISGPIVVTAPGTLTVPAGGSTTFDVTYTVAAVGAFGFDLDILSDDADEGTFDIAVAGTVTGMAGPTILSPDEREEIRRIIVEEAERDLRTDLEFSIAANREARDRFAAAQTCERLEEDLEDGRITLDDFEAECGQNFTTRDNVPFDVDGALAATASSANINGSFFGSQGGPVRRLVFGEFAATRYDDGDVTLSFNGRVAWERLIADDVLLGTFVGSTMSQSDIAGTFSGDRLGFGLNAGVYFVDQIERNVYWDGFFAVGVSQNDLDLGNGALDVGADYTSTSVQLGLALSGLHEFETFELRPELSVTYGYADLGDIDLTVTGGTDMVSAGYVSLGIIRFRPEFAFPIEMSATRYDDGEFTIAPSVSCEYRESFEEDDACGGGLELEWSARSFDGLQEFSAGLLHEVIGDDGRSRFHLQYEREF